MIFCIYEHISQKRSCLNFASQERQPSPRNEKKEPNRFQCEIGPISFFLGALLGRLFGEVYRLGLIYLFCFFVFFCGCGQTACKVEGHSTRHGSKMENRPKNQNRKVIPCESIQISLPKEEFPINSVPDNGFERGREKKTNSTCYVIVAIVWFLAVDYNRVVLNPLPDIPDSDYVNASHVDVSTSFSLMIAMFSLSYYYFFSFNQSILKPNAYIVTQGPNERTIDDFWRLIWQSNASCIVMLTKTFDFIKVHPSNRSLISSGVILPHPGLTFNELNHFSLDHLNQLVWWGFFLN